MIYYIEIFTHMPIKMGKKKYKRFGTAVGALRKKGYSKKAAAGIVGLIEKNIRNKRKRQARKRR